MNNCGVFVDVSNLYYCCGKKFEGRKLDYQKYYNKIQEKFGNIYRAFAYGAQVSDEAVHFLNCLKKFGYDVRYRRPKEGKKYVSWDVGITTDVVRLIDKLDVVILGSSSPDLVHLVDLIKERGRKIIVLAAGISRELKDSVDQYFEIEEDLLEEIKIPEPKILEPKLIEKS